MSEKLFYGRNILVVEDEYFIADAMERGLRGAGAHVVGPVASVGEALALLGSTQLDGAILDINLGGESVFPVAEALTASGIRFIFATGYSALDIPPAWRHVPRHEKPVDVAAVASALSGDNPS